ncbi:thioredoxin family protein [Haloplanus halophilus]|uniref:thioredoxin family protein n=1 Tax=Haloplanus halophilus TaxID=2949993 RepID=UPI00203BED76|nr:thioredoxin family protein [Haloplanus sp. GDY1]
MDGPSEAALESALDRLIAAGVVDERSDGLVTTDEFESTRRIYRDSYADADADRFRRTVAETFGVSEAAAGERIDAGTVTREDLIAALSIRAVLGGAESRSASDRPEADAGPGVDDQRLATMATLVGELTPASPVPAGVPELDDEEWAAFLDAHHDAVITVWRRDCAPCDALKDDLDAVLDALPDDVAVAGVDGESVPAFRRTFDVTTAPAVCRFRAGDLVDTVAGRKPPATYAEALF